MDASDVIRRKLQQTLYCDFVARVRVTQPNFVLGPTSSNINFPNYEYRNNVYMGGPCSNAPR